MNERTARTGNITGQGVVVRHFEPRPRPVEGIADTLTELRNIGGSAGAIEYAQRHLTERARREVR